MTQMQTARIFGWVCLVGGAALTAWGWFNLDQGRASRSWPTVSATIESSSVRSYSTERTGQPRYRYSPRVRFSYEVDGVSYAGDRVSFRDDHYGKRASALEIARRYRPGSEVTIHYSPDDPSQAVLEPDYDWSTYIPPAIGLLLFSTGFAVLRLMHRQLERHSPSQPH